MYPIVVVLLDGLADRAHAVFKGRTANEAARTPNLDRLVAAGSNGVIYGVGPGRAPSSEVAHWSMLGYRPDEFPGRAVFEALGRGQEGSEEIEKRVAAHGLARRSFHACQHGDSAGRVRDRAAPFGGRQDRSVDFNARVV